MSCCWNFSVRYSCSAPIHSEHTALFANDMSVFCFYDVLCTALHCAQCDVMWESWSQSEIILKSCFLSTHFVWIPFYFSFVFFFCFPHLIRLNFWYFPTMSVWSRAPSTPSSLSATPVKCSNAFEQINWLIKTHQMYTKRKTSLLNWWWDRGESQLTVDGYLILNIQSAYARIWNGLKFRFINTKTCQRRDSVRSESYSVSDLMR